MLVSFIFLHWCDFSVCISFVASVGFCSAGFLFLQKSGAKESADGKSAQLEGAKKSCAGLDWSKIWTYVSIFGWKGDVRLEASCLGRGFHDPAEDLFYFSMPFLFLFASGFADLSAGVSRK